MNSVNSVNFGTIHKNGAFEQASDAIPALQCLAVIIHAVSTAIMVGGLNNARQHESAAKLLQIGSFLLTGFALLDTVCEISNILGVPPAFTFAVSIVHAMVITDLVKNFNGLAH